jgi:hypothetical protein
MNDVDQHRAIIAVCVASLFAVCLISGCGRRTKVYPVHGRVITSDAAPVKYGIVEFRSLDSGQLARGKLDQDGKFTLTTFRPDDGAVEGKHAVVVVQLIFGNIAGLDVQHVHDHGPAIDPKFSSYQKSGLSATVNPTEDNSILLVVERQRIE